jgi:hypothetical protein
MWREGEDKPMARPRPGFSTDAKPICNTCSRIGWRFRLKWQSGDKGSSNGVELRFCSISTERASGRKCGRYCQDCCGTIEVRSNGDTTASIVCAWLLRSNSIRRSKALERM